MQIEIFALDLALATIEALRHPKRPLTDKPLLVSIKEETITCDDRAIKQLNAGIPSRNTDILLRIVAKHIRRNIELIGVKGNNRLNSGAQGLPRT